MIIVRDNWVDEQGRPNVHRIYKLDNGWEVDIARTNGPWGTKGCETGMYEALLVYPNGQQCYGSPLSPCDAIVGWLDIFGVKRVLREVASWDTSVRFESPFNGLDE